MVRLFYTSIVFCFSVLSAQCYEAEAIIKANILKGESLVWVNISAQEVEQMVQEELEKRQIRRVYSQMGVGTERLLIMDIFVYQLSYSQPTVLLTIRTNNRIHYMAKDRADSMKYGRKSLPNIIRKVIGEIPSELDLEKNRSLFIHDIFYRDQPHLYGETFDMMFNKARATYQLSMDWFTSEPLPFIIPGGAMDYLLYCVNYDGLKKILKEHEIEVIVKIDKAGVAKLEDIETPVALSEKQVGWVRNMVEALPLWNVVLESQEFALKLKIN